MSITTALKARRDALGDREAGFTLIELLVVVLIIGILAAIAIPVYLGVQNNAKDSAVKSDLANDKTAISAFVTSSATGALPTGTTVAAITPQLSNYGFSVSPGATAGSWKTSGSGNTLAFCLTEKSATGTYFSITTNTGITSQGTTDKCPAAY